MRMKGSNAHNAVINICTIPQLYGPTRRHMGMYLYKTANAEKPTESTLSRSVGVYWSADPQGSTTRGSIEWWVLTGLNRRFPPRSTSRWKGMVLWMTGLHGSMVEGSEQTFKNANLHRNITCVSVQTDFLGIHCRSTMVDPCISGCWHIQTFPPPSNFRDAIYGMLH